MNICRIVSASLFTISLMLFCTTAQSQIVPVAISSGRVHSVRHSNKIELVEYVIIMHLKQTSIKVDSTMRLYNTDVSSVETVGIQDFEWGHVPFSQYDSYGRHDYIHFKSWVNGRRIRFQHMGPGNSRSKSGWLVTNIRFPGHSETIVNLVFEVGYVESRELLKSRFRIGHSRYWKDDIKNILIILDSKSTSFCKHNSAALISPSIIFAPSIVGRCFRKLDIRNYEPSDRDYLGITVPRVSDNRPIKGPFIIGKPEKELKTTTESRGE